MTLQEIIDSEIKRGTLLPDKISDAATEYKKDASIFHHAWFYCAERPGQLMVLMMFDGPVCWFVHNLAEKSLFPWADICDAGISFVEDD